MVQASNLFWILQKVIYFGLLSLGCYFIYQGQVVQRFIIQRTDFSEYSETVSELPTLLTFPLLYNTLKFGKDFNISYGIRGSSLTRNLSIGINDISDCLQVYVDQIYNSSVFKITPLNFSSDKPLDYELAYTVDKSLLHNHTTIEFGIRLSTENNSHPINNIFRDGDGDELSSKVGRLMQINQIKPEKIIYNQQIQKCRSIPYTEIIFRKIAADILTCPIPCKPYYVGKHLDSLLGEIPFCKSKKESQCFLDLEKKFDEMVMQNDDLTKPCTLVQYKHQHTNLLQEEDLDTFVPPNVARFSFIFAAPPRVIVKEEYVIYDAIAMIGAIGGTMGLCIGISFMDCINVLINMVEKGMEKLKINKTSAPGAITPIIHHSKTFKNSATILEIRLEQCESRIEAIANELKNQMNAVNSQLQTINHRS